MYTNAKATNDGQGASGSKFNITYLKTLYNRLVENKIATNENEAVVSCGWLPPVTLCTDGVGGQEKRMKRNIKFNGSIPLLPVRMLRRVRSFGRKVLGQTLSNQPPFAL